jgi:hypothetical protein
MEGEKKEDIEFHATNAFIVIINYRDYLSLPPTNAVYSILTIVHTFSM